MSHTVYKVEQRDTKEAHEREFCCTQLQYLQRQHIYADALHSRANFQL